MEKGTHTKGNTMTGKRGQLTSGIETGQKLTVWGEGRKFSGTVGSVTGENTEKAMAERWSVDFTGKRGGAYTLTQHTNGAMLMIGCGPRGGVHVISCDIFTAEG